MFTGSLSLFDCKIWNYDVIYENLYDVYLGNYYTYGIKVLNSDEIVHDVSICKAEVIHMVNLFNNYQLSPIHLYELIEDLLK